MPRSVASQLRFQENAKMMMITEKKTQMKWFENNYEKIKFNTFGEVKRNWPKIADKLYEELVSYKKAEFGKENAKRAKIAEAKRAVNEALLSVRKRLHEYEGSTSLMRPVAEEHLKLLYDGGNSKDYLRARYKVEPCEKYILPPTMQMEYGWDTRNLATPVVGSFRRSNLCKSQFFRKNGFMPDDPNTRVPFSNAQIMPEML